MEQRHRKDRGLETLQYPHPGPCNTGGLWPEASPVSPGLGGGAASGAPDNGSPGGGSGSGDPINPWGSGLIVQMLEAVKAADGVSITEALAHWEAS